MFSGTSVSSYIYKQQFNGCTWEHSWIWKLKLHPRESIFWWRICLHAIPTMTWLCGRGLSQDTCCPWGCTQPEDTHHLLVDCIFFKQCCSHLDSWGFMLPTFQTVPAIMNWLLEAASSRDTDELVLLFCYLIYQIWRNRLAKTHNRTHATPKVVAATVLCNISTGSCPSRRFWGTTAVYGHHNPTHWCPPPDGWIKINFDGALSSSGLGGCAMVIRDHHASLLEARGSPIRHWDSGQVELAAFLQLSKWPKPWLLDKTGVIVEGDCLNVIHHIKEMYCLVTRGSRAEGHQAFTFLSAFPNVIFAHVKRECNSLADVAAKCAMETSFFWSDVSFAPPHFASLLSRERAFCNLFR